MHRLLQRGFSLKTPHKSGLLYGSHEINGRNGAISVQHYEMLPAHSPPIMEMNVDNFLVACLEVPPYFVSQLIIR